MKKEPILSVKDLGISFSQYTKGLRRRELEVITNLDIDLYEGEILAVVKGQRKIKRKRNSIYTSIRKFFRPINEGIKASKNINRE